uniref:Uncharacterized protein n=1 Tax=Schlesneria paludicola TaxID=360056 RepID=A0A7C2K103_9PLAN
MRQSVVSPFSFPNIIGGKGWNCIDSASLAVSARLKLEAMRHGVARRAGRPVSSVHPNGGRKLNHSLKAADHEDAETLLARVLRRLRLIEHGDLELPKGSDPLTFLLSDRRRQQSAELRTTLSLKSLFDAFREALP